ncbi:hypothetical protein PUNSTDRAFT_55734 [Punctularia strigosozonata HHB-11173 SS5]|uniref:WD-like domain-containing protein n=1 Tax=Punctularia strigosozonata (strain HHB-11173) TaxID=741275 RepID=R7S1Q8_PUNST|nr:uncharacterized protein PUNSTDRAFT_55734 [Punctularia strigosozonata HHB-11173 SS5]EIN04158.1 hypothetical protein PUNSTDRAFT_55734 [Punctularia strigosozonata HHB-11173 SS5]
MKLQLAFMSLLGIAMAAIVREVGDEDAYVISTKDLGADGILTVYGIVGDDAPTNSASLQARQCGSNDVTCSGSHQAIASVCSTLIGQVCNSGGSVSASPRSLCLSSSGNQCCISWSANVGAFAEFDLCTAAQDVQNECAGNAVSGVARNVNLNGGCVTQCLSNRATGCA